MLALGVSLCANAQLTVFENGKVRVGNNSSSTTSDATLDICDTESSSAPLATISGSISFGSGAGSKISGNSGLGSLNLYARNGIILGVGSNTEALKLNTVFKYLSSALDIHAPAFVTTSDVRLKTNVESLSESFLKLHDVNAVSYNLSSASASNASETAQKNSAANSGGVEDRTRFGFIAQEIQEIFPNLVVEDEDGMLAIDYTGFIPLLVEAYKDLSKKVKEQEEIIVGMSNYSGPHYMPASVGEVIEHKASLKQNKPNPFNTSTTIECTVPESAASAFICVYDLQGTQVMRLDINERGTVNSVIDASSLRQGMYIYSLIVDGTEVDSKRMIITD